MKNTNTLALGLFASALLAGCSGGGAGPSSTPMVVHPITPATSVPAAAQSSLRTANVDGSPAFVTASQMPVYVFSADKADESFCTSIGDCIGLWPAVIAPSGKLSAGFSSFVRSDSGQMQLAYNGQPLYTFVDDTQADVANGVGIAQSASDGGMGTFTLARPNSAATAAPSAAPSADPTAAPTSAPVSPYSVRR